MKWSLTRRNDKESSHPFPSLMHSLHSVHFRGLATVALFLPDKQTNTWSSQWTNRKKKKNVILTSTNLTGNACKDWNNGTKTHNCIIKQWEKKCIIGNSCYHCQCLQYQTPWLGMLPQVSQPAHLQYLSEW